MPRRRKPPDEITLPGLLAGVKPIRDPVPKSRSLTKSGKPISAARQQRLAEAEAAEQRERDRIQAQDNLRALVNRKLLRLMNSPLMSDLLQPLGESLWMPSTVQGRRPLADDQPVLVGEGVVTLSTPGCWYLASAKSNFYDEPVVHPELSPGLLLGEHHFGGFTPKLGWVLVKVYFDWTGVDPRRPVARGLTGLKVDLMMLCGLGENVADRLSSWLGGFEAVIEQQAKQAQAHPLTGTVQTNDAG